HSDRLLLSRRWAGVIETVGGLMLDTAIRQTHRAGTVACCGNVLGPKLYTSIYPFILRGLHLAGIDSGHCRMDLRKQLWNRLALDWKPQKIKEITRSCSLEALSSEIDTILEGQQTGRLVVKLD